MFGSDERDLCATLAEMRRTAIQRAHWDQNAAAKIMKGYLAADRRFDAFDPDRLIQKTEEARSRGRTMELSDPWLQKNGVKRPLDF